MRSHLARLAVLGAFAVSLAGCTGSGTSLPFAGPPNNAGGNPGTFQSGSNGSSLVRFINGAPEFPNVDICIDNLQFAPAALAPIAQYGRPAGGANASQNTLVAVAGGIGHTVAVYPSLGSTNAGLECPTAPGPYLGTAPIAIAAFTPGAGPTAGTATALGARLTIVLGGTVGKGTIGLYVFNDPVFPTSPTTASAYWHNAAPNFTAALVAPKSVGFGYCTTTVTPCAAAVTLTGAGSVPAGTKSSPSAAVVNNQQAQALLPLIPAGFYDGAGVSAGTAVPITSVATPALAAGQAPVYELVAIDGPAGGLNLVVVPEQTNGYGF